MPVESLPSPRSAEPPRILIVDDDPLIRQAHMRLLGSADFQTVPAASGEAALAALRTSRFDAVVSDISMPEMDGLTMLRRIREIDLDLPVLLVTGEASVERATEALELGAFRFLEKPANPDRLIKGVREAASFGQTARVRREAFDQLQSGQSGDRAAMEVSFERALEKLWMAYQPIVRWSSRSVYAYEALVRSAEPALPHPGALLDAAEQLGRLRELSRRIRAISGDPFLKGSMAARLFVNLHVTDLEDEALLAPDAPLAALADRVTLEITERASLHSVPTARTCIAQLRDRGYAIALDDLGAGYAGLSSFAQLEPDVIKIDMSLVRDIHRSSTKQRLVGSMFQLCVDLGREVIAEGVETMEERDCLVALGCDLFQGYLFAKPGPPFPSVSY